MVSRTLLCGIVVVCLTLVGCKNPRDGHRFTDVVEIKPSPDHALIAVLVWSEHGPGQPHLSAVVLAAKGADPLDGDAVVIASEDYRPLDFRWTGVSALEVRLPCGAWSSLANHWRVRESKRVVTVDFTPPLNCLAASAPLSSTAPALSAMASTSTTAKPIRSTALPPGASQPPGIMFSPK